MARRRTPRRLRRGHRRRGGHGLATAYYLAKEFGVRNVAVLEKGWIGGGNVGRNTTIVRSNYLLPGTSRSTSIR
jgi:glycine/D-amino acid oxidase-like deaminating enzyme